MIFLSLYIFFALSTFLTVFVAGQLTTPNRKYLWGFTSLPVTQQTIKQCDVLGVFTGNADGTAGGTGDGTAPYTMISNVGGTQTIMDQLPAKNMTWTVNRPVGSKVILNLVDAAGNQGGIPPIYTVTAGTSNACVLSQTSTSFTVKVNTTNLNTCDPLLITLTGGKKPYNLTITPTNGDPQVAQLGSQFDQFTWTNNAPPSNQVIVSAQDASGQSAISSSLISTNGNSNTQCPSPANFPSSSTSRGNSNGSNGSNNNNNNGNNHSGSSSSNNAAIIGGAVVGVLLLLGAAVAFYFRHRRFTRRKEARQADEAQKMFLAQNQTPLNTYTNTIPHQSLSSYPRPTTFYDNNPSYNNPSHNNPPYNNPSYNNPSYSNPSYSDPSYGQLNPPTPQAGTVSHSRTGSSTRLLQVTNGDIDSEGWRTSAAPSSSSSGDGGVRSSITKADKQRRMAEEEERAAPVFVRHEDAGSVPVVDLPPAYGEQRDTGSSSAGGSSQPQQQQQYVSNHSGYPADVKRSDGL